MNTPFPTKRPRELIETHLEMRDGATWIVGICPGCWEHVAALGEGEITCPNGHLLRVRSARSEGLEGRA